jgi:fatty aldehyde-generating acyl-ACP reductase
MKFATISHLLDEKNINSIPKSWIKDDIIVSPELNILDIKGYVIALNTLPKQVVSFSKDEIRKRILKTAMYAQNELNVDIIQLGALTTSVTSGGIWLAKQKEYTGYLTHGDSYTAAVTCQAVKKIVKTSNKDSSDLKLAIIGAYGIIGEAVSKILVPDFNHSILIGRRKEKLDELEKKIKGNFETTLELKTKKADVIVTATSHPTALLKSEHLKKNAIIVDVSQPPNLNYTICQQRPDIIRVDGGYVDFPLKQALPIPGLPKGKNFACIAEVIMQAMENKKQNYVGSIDLDHLKQTEKWAQKYGFTLQELTNFGYPITDNRMERP